MTPVEGGQRVEGAPPLIEGAPPPVEGAPPPMKPPTGAPAIAAADLGVRYDLRFTRNYGVSLGLLTAESVEMRWGLIVLTSVIALGVLVWMFRETAKADILGLAMVLGGAAGNIKDRLDYGFVVDYADLHFGDFRPFLIFNIADACITIGVLIILARSFLSREKPDEKAATES